MQAVAGGRISSRRLSAALISPAIPAAAFVCPMFALSEPIAAVLRAPASARARASAPSSVASPIVVPVPWPSKSATVSIPNPARS